MTILKFQDVLKSQMLAKIVKNLKGIVDAGVCVNGSMCMSGLLLPRAYCCALFSQDRILDGDAEAEGG